MKNEKPIKKCDWVHICISGKKEFAEQVKTLLDLVLRWKIVDSDKDEGAKMLKFPKFGEYLNNTNRLSFYILDRRDHDLGEKAGFIINVTKEITRDLNKEAEENGGQVEKET